jgi:tRNA G18 (ribose-2'-O)-methylase SpoU
VSSHFAVRPDWFDTGLIAVAHDVRSMHNIGAIFRTADGAGFAGLVLSGISGAPPDPRIAKVALGAERTVPHTIAPDIDALLDLLDEVHVVLLEQAPGAVAISELAVPSSSAVALVVCGEITGAPRQLLSRADQVAEIPMFGSKESLNVSVAFGIAAYQLGVQRRSPQDGLQAVRGPHPVRDGVLTHGVTQGQTPSRKDRD